MLTSPIKELPISMNYRDSILEDLLIEAQPSTPFVKFKKEQGLLVIKGVSTETHAIEFYAPIVTIVDSYLSTSENLACYFFFREINLSTTGSLFHLFKSLGEYQKLGKKITINWFADWHNHEMIQTGNDYAKLYGLHMHILPV